LEIEAKSPYEEGILYYLPQLTAEFEVFGQNFKPPVHFVNRRGCVRVARWFVFRTKNTILGNFGMKKVGLFSGRLEHITAFWYM
jgi:hypothetical protein